MLYLHKDSGKIEHRAFRDVLDILQPGDLLVANDTRVTAVRLFGHRETGGQVEALLLRERAPAEYVALAKPGKRLKPGAIIHFPGDLTATVLEVLDTGERVLSLNTDREEGTQTNAERVRELLRTYGTVPLPPYITQRLDNPERYQTVYSQTGGSAAAPTAGLHFTPELIDALRAKGVKLAKVTLDVGIDTFRPIQSDSIEEHQMHGETCTIPEETAKAIADCKGRVIAVGTTSARTLESMATGQRQVQPGSKETPLLIRPGYEFKVIDGMFTNFHMPRTTMLLMISTLAGRENIREAYDEALENRYRFLSFGDAMLIL